MATYTNLNNEIFGQPAIEGLCKVLMPITRFARNYSPSPAQKGDQVLVPLISTLTATTFGGSYNVCGGTKTVATINLTSHKIVTVGQSDITAHSSSESDLKSFGYQMGKALGTLILQDILTLVTTATGYFSSVTNVSTTALGLAELRASRLALNRANVPGDPRVCVLDCVPYDSLLAVTNFVQAQMFKDQSVLQEGRVMRALGMDFYELNGLFTASVQGFVAHPDAIAVAMRYLAPQEGHGYNDAHAIVDPESGLVVGLRDFYDENTGSRFITLECLYGKTVGLCNCGRIINRTD